MKIFAATQKGINKQENEDCIAVGRTVLTNGWLFTEMDHGILAVADGVGGNAAGYVASRYVADRVCCMKEIDENGLSSINNELLSLSNEKSDYFGMATTLSGILISEEKTTIFSIGNSRVYLLQGGIYLKQLTKDDTTVNYLLSTGKILPEEVDNFERKTEITACFGGGTSGLFKITIKDMGIVPSSIIVTSDGIHDHLSIDQMEDIIAENGLTQMTCEKMIDEARKCGSVDDVSIVLGVMQSN